MVSNERHSSATPVDCTPYDFSRHRQNPCPWAMVRLGHCILGRVSVPVVHTSGWTEERRQPWGAPQATCSATSRVQGLVQRCWSVIRVLLSMSFARRAVSCDRCWPDCPARHDSGYHPPTEIGSRQRHSAPTHLPCSSGSQAPSKQVASTHIDHRGGARRSPRRGEHRGRATSGRFVPQHCRLDMPHFPQCTDKHPMLDDQILTQVSDC